MSNARAYISWSMILVATTIGACGGAAELVVEPSGEARPSTASQPASNDQSEFEAAKDALRSDSTGRFVREVWIDPPKGKKAMFLHSKGRYDVSKHRSRGLATIADPTGKIQPVEFQFASNARRVFLHSPAWGCWLALTAEDIAAGTGIDASPRTARLPAEIAVLLRARTNFDWGDATVIDATVPARIVASLAGSYVYKRLRGKMSGMRVQAKIHLKSGRFVSWTVRGSEIATQLMTQVSPTKPLRKIVYGLQSLKFHVELSDLGAQLRVPIPRRSDWVELSPGAKRFNPNACGGDGEVI